MPTAMTRTDLAKVWQDFRKSGERRLRNVLMENYLPIVRFNAERIGAKLPDEVELDDLISAGVFGLLDAVEAFDLNRGVKFETYCAPRIRGAILDELRNMDWVPRLVRSRAAKLERVVRELESTLGRAPTEAELAQRMKLPRREFDKLLRDSTAVTQISLSRKCNDEHSNKDVCEIDVIEDNRGHNPVKEIQKRDLKALMLKGLTRAERLILVLYYYEELTMREIGEVLDLSESRVSQMHSSILERLKTQLQPRQKELVH